MEAELIEYLQEQVRVLQKENAALVRRLLTVSNDPRIPSEVKIGWKNADRV